MKLGGIHQNSTEAPECPPVPLVLFCYILVLADVGGSGVSLANDEGF